MPRTIRSVAEASRPSRSGEPKRANIVAIARKRDTVDRDPASIHADPWALDVGGDRHGPEHPTLERMPRGPIGLEVPAAVRRRDQEPRVVPRTAVPDPRSGSLGRAVARRSQRRDGHRSPPEQAANGCHVDVLSGVGGAHHRDLVVGQLGLVHRGERHRALHRLLTRPTEEEAIGVAREGTEPSVRVADGHVTHVHGLDETVANDVDQLGGSRHRGGSLPTPGGRRPGSAGRERRGEDPATSDEAVVLGREDPNASTQVGSNCVPDPAQDLRDGLLGGERRSVGPVARHRVERVRDREDPGRERDLFSGGDPSG